MCGTNRRRYILATLAALALLCGQRAGVARADDPKIDDIKASDEGKVEDFKEKKFDLKEKGLAGILLTMPAGKKFAVSVRSEKKTDINLFVYDAAKKLVAKDDSPGPEC